MNKENSNYLRALTLGVFTLSFTCLSAQAAVDTKKSEAYFESAVEELRSDNTTAATIQLRNALQQNPQNLPARISLGKVLLLEDQPLAAIKELETAQAMGGDPNLTLVPLARAYLTIAKPEQVITGIVANDVEPAVAAEINLLKADAYMQLGSLKEAENLYLEASSLIPVDPRPLLGTARIDMAKGRITQAMQQIDQAVALAPENFPVLLFKATAHRDFGQYELAAQTFEQALAVEPGSVRALTARAAMWMDLGRLELAKVDLEAASNFGPDSLETIYLRSVVLFSENKEDEARAVLRRGADEIRQIKDSYRSKFPNTMLMLGVVAFFDKNYSEAIANLVQFTTKVPNHPGAKRYLASAYLAKSEWDSIKKLLIPSSGERLRDPFTLSILAEAHRATGDFRAAERYYDTALKIAPHVAGIGLKLAENRLDAGRPKKAIEELGELLERFPELFEAHAQLVRVHMKTGNTSLAIQHANELIKKFPANARAFTVASGVQMSAGNLVEARHLLEKSLLIDPEALMPTLNLARIARMEGHYDTAQAQYRSTLERFPKSLEAQIELAEMLFERGEIEELKTRLDTILSSYPKSIRAHNLKLSLTLATATEIDEVRKEIFELSQAFPENAEIALKAGTAYRRIGDTEDAKLSFRHAVEFAQYDRDILYRVANQQLGIKDLNGALWSLTKASQASPDDLQVLVLQAAVLTLLNDFDRARENITKAKEIHGDQAEIFLVEGDFFMKQNMLDEATAVYRRSWELKPAPKTAQTFFRSLISSDKHAEAEKHLRDWTKKYPQDVASRTLLADMLTYQQRWDEAREAWEALQQDGIEELQLMNNLAAVYQRLNDPRALPAAELIYERAPDNAAVLDTYGWILTQNGRVEEGLAILREAYSRASTQPEIRFHIGEALAKLGRNEEAKEEVQAALEEGTNFVDKNAATDLLQQLDN